MRFAILLLLSWDCATLKGCDMSHSPSDWTLSDAKIISPDEVRTILARAKSLGEMDPDWHRDYEFFAVAAHTGLRVSEVAHIEKDDVMTSRLMMTRRKKKHLHPAPIEVMPEILAMLRNRADAVEAGYVFPGRCQPCVIQRLKRGPEQVCVGGHASLRNIQRRWRILLEDLGLYKYGRGIHSLRHTAITEMYKLTRDLRKAQVFAGHSNSAITERYAHVVDMQESLNDMPRMM